MSVVISRNVVLSSLVSATNRNRPIIGWHNIITRDNIEVSEGESDRLTNPNTASRWVSEGAATITIDTLGELVDYVGIARHNLGSQGAIIEVQVPASDAWLLSSGSWGDGVWIDAEDPEEDGGWVTVAGDFILPNDEPAILRFDPIASDSIRISISEAAYIGVLYVGRLTVMPPMLQDHVPARYADTTEVVSGLAESGDFLGRIVTNETKNSDMRFMEVEYSWFEEHMGPFVQASRTLPFFFAWLPGDRPMDSGFGWLSSDIRPRVFRHVPDTLVCDFDIQFGALVR